jgi:hypothetical protein
LRGWRPILAALPGPVPPFSVPGLEDFPFTTGPKTRPEQPPKYRENKDYCQPAQLWKLWEKNLQIFLPGNFAPGMTPPSKKFGRLALQHYL